MQTPDSQSTAIKSSYQAPKLEVHGVWELKTGVTLSIGGSLVPSEFEVKL